MMASIYMGTGAIHGGVRCPLSAGAPQSTCFYGRNGTVKGSRCIDAKATTVKSAPPAEIAEEHRTSSAAIKSAYSKIDFEQEDEIQVQIEGKIPEWLNGKLLINGVGNYDGVNHMFDGLAMVHKLRISNGEVFSSHKFLRTEAYEHFMKEGKVQCREFATPAEKPGVLGVVRNLFRTAFDAENSMTDNSSVNIISVGDKFLATSETKRSLYEIDVDNLDLGPTFPLKLKCDTITAHPSFTSNGDVINLATDFTGKYMFYRMKKGSADAETIRTIQPRNQFSFSWLHDFPCSDKYAALLEHPGKFDVAGMMLNEVSEYAALNWSAEDDTLIHLVPLEGDEEVRTFRCPSIFVLHFANAYESEDGRFFCFDAAAYDDLQIINDLYLDTLRKAENIVSPSAIKRFKLPLNTTSEEPIYIEPEEIVNPACHGNYVDFPSINSRYRGKKHRYIYGVGMCGPSSASNAVVKFDIEEGTTKVWGEPGSLTGEPTFVESPSPKSEDDGVILSSVIRKNGKTSLIILDAVTWEELAVATLPYGIPYRFHGEFIED